MTTAHQRWVEQGEFFTSIYKVVASVVGMSSHSALGLQVRPMIPHIFGISISRRTFKYL